MDALRAISELHVCPLCLAWERFGGQCFRMQVMALECLSGAVNVLSDAQSALETSYMALPRSHVCVTTQ
jgi:hypothetical protein